eukprot:CAMPEP_0170212984 /NCGR_PEP_ID=MMETSP0116_2-20130129/6114_1 /TAXON_ID=400756 /ORGANISM="Durinskia baltica, Strain CSIRO CS-38" /LENGTH=555 /DNA_ID=CAMNT_0010463531 /DNA_START=116 /DNA_END=1783 /DNA_ORIENTATION=-
MCLHAKLASCMVALAAMCSGSAQQTNRQGPCSASECIDVDERDSLSWLQWSRVRKVAHGPDELGGLGWLHPGPTQPAPFPIVYSVLGLGGQPYARAIVGIADSCPPISIDGLKEQPEVTIRATGSGGLPYDFPVRVCEAALPIGHQGGTFGGRPVPAMTQDPTKYLLVGDTGLRLKVKNLGNCKEFSDSETYGVPMCRTYEAFNKSNVKGDVQSLDNWPLYDLFTSAAETNPDLVVHLGDYLYRQTACPREHGCDDVSSGSWWGDTWRGWFSDFFDPARPLLESAPWIVIRGNHEDCSRAGHGWFMFMDPRPLPPNWSAGYCESYTEPYSIPFKHEQLLIIDDTAIKPKAGGIDHFDFLPACSAGEAQAVSANRHEDPSQNLSFIDAQVQMYTRHMRRLADLAKGHKTNIYVGHRPLFAFACNHSEYTSLDWTMQQAWQACAVDLGSVVLAISGHMHWFTGVEYAGRAHPTQVVVGHGGTKLIPNSVPEQEFEGSQLEILGAKVSRGSSKSAFGYATLTSGDGDSPLAFSAMEMSPGSLTAKTFWEASVPREPRY